MIDIKEKQLISDIYYTIKEYIFEVLNYPLSPLEIKNELLRMYEILKYNPKELFLEFIPAHLLEIYWEELEKNIEVINIWIALRLNQFFTSNKDAKNIIREVLMSKIPENICYNRREEK